MLVLIENLPGTKEIFLPALDLKDGYEPTPVTLNSPVNSYTPAPSIECG